MTTVTCLYSLRRRPLLHLLCACSSSSFVPMYGIGEHTRGVLLGMQASSRADILRGTFLFSSQH